MIKLKKYLFVVLAFSFSACFSMYQSEKNYVPKECKRLWHESVQSKNIQTKKEIVDKSYNLTDWLYVGGKGRFLTGFNCLLKKIRDHEDFSESEIPQDVLHGIIISDKYSEEEKKKLVNMVILLYKNHLGNCYKNNIINKLSEVFYKGKYIKATPLILASRCGLSKVVNLLIKARADIYKEDGEGKAFIDWDQEREKKEGISVRPRVWFNNFENIREQVRKGKSLFKVVGKQGETFFDIAKRGARKYNFSMKGILGEALVSAAGRGKLEEVKMLVDAGADVAFEGKTYLKGKNADYLAGKDTALHAAICTYNYDIAKFLVEKGGADVNKSNEMGGVSLALIRSFGDEEWKEVKSFFLDFLVVKHGATILCHLGSVQIDRLLELIMVGAFTSKKSYLYFSNNIFNADSWEVLFDNCEDYKDKDSIKYEEHIKELHNFIKCALINGGKLDKFICNLVDDFIEEYDCRELEELREYLEKVNEFRGLTEKGKYEKTLIEIRDSGKYIGTYLSLLFSECIYKLFYFEPKKPGEIFRLNKSTAIYNLFKEGRISKKFSCSHLNICKNINELKLMPTSTSFFIFMCNMIVLMFKNNYFIPRVVLMKVHEKLFREYCLCPGFRCFRYTIKKEKYKPLKYSK